MTRRQDEGPKTRRVLGPAVAGTWYPSSPAALERDVDRLLVGAPADRPPIALVVPHAGYVYSGAVAGQAFARLAGRAFRRVILIGPSHRAAFRGACLPAAEVYRTPLGDVAIDRDGIARLAGHPDFRVDDGPFVAEHCLEAEIPFLQRMLSGEWTLVPLLIGAGTEATRLESVSFALRSLPAEGRLLVVSSDFTHYGPRFGYVPFESDLPRRIRELDMGAIDHIVRLDRAGFAAYVAETGATICGRAAIEVLLGVLPAGVRAELVSYDTSASMTGDWDHSVSYASLAFSP